MQNRLDDYEYEQRLSILVLRTLDCTRDEICDILHCRPLTHQGAEEWMRSCPLDSAIKFCDNQNVKDLINLKSSTWISERLDPEKLVPLGRLRGEDILRKYRPDYVFTRPTLEERERYLGLLRQWREQARFRPVDSLLFLYRWRVWEPILLPEGSDLRDMDESTKLHVNALELVQPIIADNTKRSLAVESEVAFQQLKMSYPNSGVWQAQRSWHVEYEGYIDAFVLWLRAVHYSLELSIALATMAHDSKPPSMNMDEFRQSFREAVAANFAYQYMHNLECDMAAGLLILAIERHSLPDNEFWKYQLGTMIKAIRSSASLFMFVPALFEGALNKVTPQSLWEDYQEVRDTSLSLLKALETMQAAHNKLHNELRVLETNLTSQASYLGPSSNQA